MSKLMTTLKTSRSHLLLLAFILAIGFALRLSQPTLVEFKRDEATIARLGQAIAYEGFLPAVGVDSSLGIDNLPLTLYLVALPLRLWSDPLSAVIFTCFLNSLALVGCYLLARISLGKTEALLATWLFAVSPWAVLYARKIWARTLPLVTLAFILLCVLVFVFHKRWALVAAFVSLAALLGLQLEALAFVPILGVALLLYNDALDWRALVIGVGVFLILMLPYIVHDARHGWENARGVLAYAGGDSAFSWDAVRYAVSLLGSQGIEGQAGPFHAQFRRSLGLFWWLNDLLTVLLLVSLIYAVIQAVRAPDRARRRLFTLLLLWFAIPILLQLSPSSPTQRHYYVMHYPVQYLLIAAFAVGVGRRLMGRLRRAAVLPSVIMVFLVLFGAWQIAVTAELRYYMAAHPATGGYGVPLRFTRRAAALARDLAPEGEVVVLSETTRPFMAETPTVFDALLFDVPHRFADGRAALPIPQASAITYLVGPLDRVAFATGAAPLESALSRLMASAIVEPGPALHLTGGTAYQTYRWTAGARDALTAGMKPLAQGIPFANDVVFAAFEAPEALAAGGEAEVWLVWWVRTGAAAAAETHFTVQLLNSDGAVVAQDDHAGYPSAWWRAEDLVLSRFRLRVPVDAGAGYRLRAGMYTYPQIEPVPVVDPGGMPIDDGVMLIDALDVVEASNNVEGAH
jgi:hypothetical protein